MPSTPPASPIPDQYRETLPHYGPAFYPASLAMAGDASLWLTRRGAQRSKRLALLARPSDPLLKQFEGEPHEFQGGFTLLLCPVNPASVRALRSALACLQPVPLGLGASAGFGDRLGLATPGHARAVRRSHQGEPARKLAPIFAQQSIREMARTGRAPEDVLADATWGAFEAGWRDPVGADADHLKTADDIDACAAAGFSFFTFDPGEHVDAAADQASASELERLAEALPWPDLETTWADSRRRYAGLSVALEGLRVSLSEAEAARAAAKYGRALAHVARLYRHLAGKGIPFEVEVSVDETDTPTSHGEHYYFASELRRLGVEWVSLAPRYVGRFEKGVDYIGDLEALRADLAGHAALARALGPYKLSLHSGSDKFSVYPLIAEAAQGLVHLKTAGTSYLEALRTIAGTVPELFREVAALSLERYPADRASYHVSAEVERVPSLGGLADAELPSLLDHFDARQILHVTFGSALKQFEDRIKAALQTHEEAHYAALESHFARHLRPFVAA
jgi:hypothetical protein